VVLLAMAVDFGLVLPAMAVDPGLVALAGVVVPLRAHQCFFAGLSAQAST
jgi:hypothetical protein